MRSSNSRTIPSNDECRIGAKLALENSEGHYQCANHLEEIGEFGIAEGHLVLSVEEGIKAFFLFWKGIGIPIKQKWLFNILSHHKPRHEVGGVFYVFYSLFKWIYEIIQKANERMIAKEKDDALRIRNETFQKILRDLKTAANATNDSSEIGMEISQKVDWWKEAEQKKQAGFYVDYSKNDWSSPKYVMQENYLESKKIAHQVIQNIKIVFESLELMPDNEKRALIQEVKKKYNNKSWT